MIIAIATTITSSRLRITTGVVRNRIIVTAAKAHSDQPIRTCGRAVLKAIPSQHSVTA